MSNDFEVMKEAYIKMGYGENMATLMARGRGELTETGENTHYEPGELPPSAPDLPNVPGKFGINDTMDSQDQQRSFLDTLDILGLKVEDVKQELAHMRKNDTRLQAAAALEAWFVAAGFKPAEATRAALALVGPDEFPAVIARHAHAVSGGTSGQGQSKESKDPSADLVQAFGELGLNENESRRWINRHNILGREDEPEPLKEAGTQP